MTSVMTGQHNCTFLLIAGQNMNAVTTGLHNSLLPVSTSQSATLSSRRQLENLLHSCCSLPCTAARLQPPQHPSLTPDCGRYYSTGRSELRPSCSRTEPWHDPRSCLTGCSSTDHMTRGTFPPSHRQQRIPSNLHHHLLHPSLTVHIVTACVTHPLPAALGRHQPVQKVEVDLAPVDAGHVLEIRPESQTIKSLHWKILSLE